MAFFVKKKEVQIFCFIISQYELNHVSTHGEMIVGYALQQFTGLCFDKLI